MAQYNSSQEYMAALDELLKKNKQNKLLFAQDTNPYAYTVEGTRARNPSGLQGAPAPINQSQTPAIQSQSTYPDLVQTQQPSQSSGGMSFQDFQQAIKQTQMPSAGTQRPYVPPAGQPPTVEGMDAVQSNNNGTFTYADNTIRDTQGQVVGQMVNGTPQYAPWVGDQYNPNNWAARYGAKQPSLQAPTSQPVASFPGNRYMYDNGEMRYGNQLFKQGQGKEYSGVEGIGSSLFGKNKYTKTQDFGNYNPNPYYTYHQGVDLATDTNAPAAEFRLPFDTQVVEAYTANDGNAYGNSYLLKLPSGQMIRVSHMDQTGGWKVGDTIKANDLLGVEGSTGNVTGKHADIELYTDKGQIENPSNFLVKAQDYMQKVPNQPATGSIMPNADMKSDPLMKMAQGWRDRPNQSFADKVQQPIQQTQDVISNIPNQIAQGINKANPTGNFDLGVTEALQGNLPQAGQKLAGTIERMNPTGNFDLGISEGLKGDTTAAKNKLAGTINRLNPTGKGIDFGVTEMLTNKPQLAKQKQMETMNAMGNIFKTGIGNAQKAFNEFSLVKPVSAAEYGQPVQKSQPSTLDNAISKAGEGIKGLQSGMQGALDQGSNIFKKMLPTKSKMIGEDGSSGDMAANPVMSKTQIPNDIRDQFFKAGGADTYGDYLNEGVNKNYRGALDTNVFKSNFYEDPNRVAHVFGQTGQAQNATDLYRQYIEKTYPIVPGHTSPTVKKTATGKYEDGSNWSIDYEDVDPVYYENQFNQEQRNAVPKTLTSDYKWQAPQTSSKSNVSPMAAASNVKSQFVAPQSKAAPVPAQKSYSNPFEQAANTSVYSTPQGKANIPTSNGYPAPRQSALAPQQQSAPKQQSSAPRPAPAPTPAPRQSAPAPQQQQSRPAPQQQQSRPNAWSAPKNNYVAPRPQQQQSRPAPQQSKPSNTFQNIVNTIKSWFKW